MDATPDAQSQWDFSCDLEVDFGSEENASIVYATIMVDKELQPDKVKRLMTVSNGKLSVHFEAIEARFLRASFSAFVDVLTLATKTIEEFGQGMELWDLLLSWLLHYLSVYSSDVQMYYYFLHDYKQEDFFLYMMDGLSYNVC